MTDKPKALELADHLEVAAGIYGCESEAAAELRRLHAVNLALCSVLHQVRIGMGEQDVLPEWWDAVDEVLADAKEST